MTLPAPDQGLDSLDIFSSLSQADRADLASRFETLALKRGELLIRQGEAADALFIVMSGRFAVFKDGRRTPVTEIGPGQPVGEIGFLRGGTRTATVTAMRDSLVMRLGRDDFDDLTNKNPAIWRTLTATLARRLAETTAAAPTPPDPRPRTIAVIRAGGEAMPEKFFDLLAATFSENARTLVVTSGAAIKLFGNGATLASTDATRKLNDLESRYDYVLFVADPDLTPWSEKAIRHADLVIAAGSHASDPEPNALEQMAAEFVAPDARRLVLVHDSRKRVSGTARWLERRNVAMHHHVALDTTADVARLFRFVNGTAKGLVACGGGALCSAHIGLYKALAEAGHTFDIMGGTSAGSAMTAAFVLGSAPGEIDDAIHDMFVSHKAMRRYTLPRYSLLDHTNFDAQLKRHYGGIDIEDMWLPYFAISTNLSRYGLHVHRQGELWAAIRASAAIPVLLPPIYTREGEMLVDGGLLDNVPIRAMHDLKSGPNVVVSFMLPELERFPVDYDTLPSRNEMMRLALHPLKRGALPSAPGLVTVLMRSLMANRNDFKCHLGPDDLLLVPPVPADMGFLDWHRHGELLDSVYRWGKEELARLEAALHGDALDQEAPRQP